MKQITSFLILFTCSFMTYASNAASVDKLTVYTYDSFAAEWGPGPAIKTAFEKQCHCELNFVTLGDGVSILNRLRLEGKNSAADVVLGLDNSLIIEAQKTNLLAEHRVDTKKLSLPNGWSDKTFVPYDYGYFAFIYDKTKLQIPPKSLKELVEQQDELSIIYQDPRTSTPGQGLLLWMKSVYGDKAPQAWAQLAKKTVTVTKGWSEAYSLFLKGESDMVLSYTTSPAYHLIAEDNNHYAAADFSEGHYMQIEVAAKVKSTKHDKLADQFLDFILTDEFQSTIATGNWMYPVTSVALPKGFNSLTVPETPLLFSPETVAKQRKSWIREWQQALIE